MQKILDILAEIWSIVCYPLFMPFYGMILFCSILFQTLFLPFRYYALCLSGTFFFTILIPLCTILILMWKGKVSDIHITDGKQRTIPYLYSIVGFGCWAYFMNGIMHAPIYIVWTAIGGTLALGIVFVINYWWKISAHLTGIGGLTGGILSYCYACGQLPSMLLSILVIVALTLMYARLRLNAHTPEQVCCGYLLGLICTFLPNYIHYYV